MGKSILPCFIFTLLHTYNYIMSASTEKRLFNRFDQYEIASVFTETAEDYLSKKLKGSLRRFGLKAILGVLLFINGYLSHWGPWTWPSNYYIIAFSVVFYHIASHLYGNLTGINNIEGNFVGDYVFEKEVKGVTLRIDKDCRKYFLEVVGDKQGSLTTELVYTDYFTTKGYFLEAKYRETLQRFVGQVQKAERKG